MIGLLLLGAAGLLTLAGRTLAGRSLANSRSYGARMPMTGGHGRKRLAALRKRPWHSLTEAQRLALLTSDVQRVAVELVRQLRVRGYDARLGETYRDEEGQRRKFEDGRSAIRDLGWHTLGRAFHVLIVDKDGKIDEKAYDVAGRIARGLGVIWKGDRLLKNKYGQPLRDLAHFEYHPGMTLAQARRAVAKQRMPA